MTQLVDLVDLPDAAAPIASLAVAGVCADSRQVKRGDVFFALAGAKRDGLAFINEAAARGAAAIVAERAPERLPAGLAYVNVVDARAALARAAARLYPGQPQTIVAVTGTSGKTSVAAFTRQLWARLGHEAGALGTLGIVSRKINLYGSLTTPDPIALHRALDELARAGVTHLAMEASSHGLDQRRLDGVRLAAGAFTNLSRDHLDYHATDEAYLAAKLRLFDELLRPGAPAVIDADSQIAARVVAAAERRGLAPYTIGAKGHAIRLLSVAREGFATRLSLACGELRLSVRLPLPGDFQVSNALVAAGLCIVTGGDPAATLRGLESLTGAPGRLEWVGERREAPIFIDYAHKPDALDKALATLRPLVRGRLIVVFGCGGDRDPGKRPMMGQIAARGADVVIVTDDNPRSEDPAAIRAAIRAAAPAAIEIGDRRHAIYAAIDMLGAGDALLIAGKGHETGQIVGDRTLAFSDHEAARAALEAAA